jgi:hypothetical protein
MKDILIFNHHSLPFDSVDNLDYHVTEFLKLCISAQKTGFTTILFDHAADSSWFLLELAPGYMWKDWHDKNKNEAKMRDQIRAFRSITTRQPLFLQDTEEDESFQLFEAYQRDSKNSLSALKAAAWYNTMLVSFPSKAPWNSSPVSVVIYKIQDESIDELDCAVTNLYSYNCLEKIRSNLVQERNSAILSGRDLWDKCSELFPLLDLCGEAQSQLRNWSDSASCLEQTKHALTILSKFCEKWKTGEYKNYTHEALKQLGLSHRVSGESKSCNNNQKSRNTRNFYLSSGECKYFENHIKISLGFRIYFYCNTEEKSIHVGYIGPHM